MNKQKILAFLSVFLLGLFALTVNPAQAQAAQGVKIADSINDFSGTQGKDNWFYGYVGEQLYVPYFEEMSDYTNSTWQIDPNTQLSSESAKPSKFGSKKWPIRRWKSEVDGEITITGQLAKAEIGGDGVKGYIFVDGERVWSKKIEGSDSQGIDFSIKATVKKGSEVDFVVGTRKSDELDETKFVATIYGQASNPAATVGLWETVPLPANRNDWMQAVHTAVLPNGKVLIANGSSNRNTLIEDGDKFIFSDGVDSSDDVVVDNSSLFDPETNTYERIASPPGKQNGQSNDLFCSGHIHLFDGNVLFVSGTNRYYPGENFEGSKQTNIYNWKENKWTTAGLFNEGRWYPSLVPLSDGKIVIFSGLKFGKPGQIAHTIEIYDPKTEKLNYIDLDYIEDSPFNVKVEYEDTYEYKGETITKKIDTYDSIDIYPRIFPTADGRLLITGDGAGKFPLEVHASNKSYLMSVIDKGDGNLDVTFEVGPDREELSKVYGSGLLDPYYQGDVLLVGGLVNTNSIAFGWPQFPELKDSLKKKGAKISTSLERWVSPKNPGEKGKWEVVEDFLDTPRAMNMAVILPTKEVLVINGGQYAEYAPIYEPVLMTPDETAPGGYKAKTMSPAELPRLYHNAGLLLPDARVLAIGGNPRRAARKEDGTVRVDDLPVSGGYYTLAPLTNEPNQPKGSGHINTQQEYETFLTNYYKDPQNSYFAEEDPLPFVPAEIYQAEIFSPPYLFKPGARPEIVDAPETLKYGQSDTIAVKDATQDGSLVMVKLGTVTHSLDYGQLLAEATINNVDIGATSAIDFTAPDNANLYPPGYYMMFYVNDIGKPSKAKMVKLEV
ncbi:MAG: galactose oxidase early set domain-containing protein [Microcoleaceae cyanobacterium MO_207.B10]|nr:galactose oxidase early set domain-containing protein [Microcoleaceae cyanobacterium MO_207.B10]